MKEDLRQRSTRAVASGSRFVGGKVKRGAGAVHRYTLSGGAGESGLARLTYLRRPDHLGHRALLVWTVVADRRAAGSAAPPAAG